MFPFVLNWILYSLYLSICKNPECNSYKKVNSYCVYNNGKLLKYLHFFWDRRKTFKIDNSALMLFIVCKKMIIE